MTSTPAPSPSRRSSPRRSSGSGRSTPTRDSSRRSSALRPSFTFEDGFASDDSFTPLPDLPISHNVYEFEPTASGTRATFTATYASAEALQQVLNMGVVEGATSAIGQIDALLGD